jgi:hypothetical protein
VHTFHNLSFLKFRLRDTANAVGSKVSVSRLNAAQAAEVFVSRFLPFCDQVCVGDALSQAVIVELARYDFSTMEHVVDVSGFLVMDLEDWPQ